jgi:hypothetical protein
LLNPTSTSLLCMTKRVLKSCIILHDIGLVHYARRQIMGLAIGYLAYPKAAPGLL